MYPSNVHVKEVVAERDKATVIEYDYMYGS